MGGHFVVAATDRREGEDVDLLAPSGAAALDRDLAREDAAEGAGGAGGGAGAKFSGDEGEFVEASGDGAQKGEDVDEGAVVERDRVVVATFEGKTWGQPPLGYWAVRR